MEINELAVETLFSSSILLIQFSFEKVLTFSFNIRLPA